MAAMRLSGAVVVVTGASSGLGRRFASDFAADGATVVGIARRESLLASLGEELKQWSPGSRTLVCDVSDTNRFADVLREVEREHGRIDVLVNNAGVGEPADQAIGGYRAVMETNFFAAVAGTLAVLPGMKERRHGAVVNVSSDIARAPTPGEAAYAASKAALTAFTESLSFEAERFGVHLHLLYPGWVPTSMAATDEDNWPPRVVRRTEEQVSRLLRAKIGSAKVDIDAAPIARLAPVARALVPGLYRKGVRTSG